MYTKRAKDSGTLTFGDLAAFVQRAQALGCPADAPVEAETTMPDLSGGLLAAAQRPTYLTEIRIPDGDD